MFTLPSLSARYAPGILIVLALLLVAPLRAMANSDEPSVSNPAPIVWKDLSGRAYDAKDISSAKATVFFFTSNQCPVAGRYGARYALLAKEYAPKGVAFYLVNANSSDSPQAFAKWAKERDIALPLVKDDSAALADRLNATTTPQAVVLDPEGKIAYLGAIDDNADAQKVTRQDLRNALDDVLTGKPVRRPRMRAFGCAIFRDKPTAVPVMTKVTYAQDIAPILQKNCLSCHRTGDVAPFPLENYEQARQWASAIKSYTARRLMPPWKAAPGHGEFFDTRYLSDDQLAKIAAWADGGTPPGDLKQTPKPPKMTAAGDWELGKPDLVVQPIRPYHLEAEGRDVYRNFTLPIDFTQDRYVSAFDFQPTNRTIVHHIIAYIDVTGQTAAQRDNKEAEPGWSVGGGGSGIKDDDWGSGWAPGMNPRRLPPGIAVKIPKGAKLVLQVHYHKSGKPEVDQSKMAIYWAKEPVQKELPDRRARQWPLFSEARCRRSVRQSLDDHPLRRQNLGYPAAYAYARQGDEGLGRPARWHGEIPDLCQELGVQLADGLPLQRADFSAQGNPHQPDCAVRQHGEQPEPALESAASGDIWRTDHR